MQPDGWADVSALRRSVGNAVTGAVMFGALTVSAILAHHGSPWLAFTLGCVALVTHLLGRLIDVLDPVGEEDER